jgi:hypothetical protein
LPFLNCFTDILVMTNLNACPFFQPNHLGDISEKSVS